MWVVSKHPFLVLDILLLTLYLHPRLLGPCPLIKRVVIRWHLPISTSRPEHAPELLTWTQPSMNHFLWDKLHFKIHIPPELPVSHPATPHCQACSSSCIYISANGETNKQNPIFLKIPLLCHPDSEASSSAAQTSHRAHSTQREHSPYFSESHSVLAGVPALPQTFSFSHLDYSYICSQAPQQPLSNYFPLWAHGEHSRNSNLPILTPYLK